MRRKGESECGSARERERGRDRFLSFTLSPSRLPSVLRLRRLAYRQMLYYVHVRRTLFHCSSNADVLLASLCALLV